MSNKMDKKLEARIARLEKILNHKQVKNESADELIISDDDYNTLKEQVAIMRNAMDILDDISDRLYFAVKDEPLSTATSILASCIGSLTEDMDPWLSDIEDHYLTK